MFQNTGPHLKSLKHLRLVSLTNQLLPVATYFKGTLDTLKLKFVTANYTTGPNSTLLTSVLEMDYTRISKKTTIKVYKLMNDVKVAGD